MSENGDPLAFVNALLSAASKTPDLGARTLYVGQARAAFADLAARLESAKILLEAQESELARIAPSPTPSLPGVR